MTRVCSRKSAKRTGGKPITRRPVWPVPKPSITRPGAISLIVAIECTVTGGIRFEATEMPVASLIFFELTAASAMHAYTSPHIIWESANHA